MLVILHAWFCSYSHNHAMQNGWTALIIAVYNRHFEAAKLLLDNFADVNAHGQVNF